MTGKKISSAAFLSFLVLTTACDFTAHHEKNTLLGNTVVATSDYTTGALAAIDTAAGTSNSGILQGNVDSDLKIRTFNGLYYILNNSNGNIQLINKNAQTIAQESTGEYSYPHDLVVTGSTGYVALYGSAKLLIIDASTLKKTAEIDLAAYTPSGASTPSIDQLWLDADTGYLYVSMQRIVWAGYSSSIDYSSIVVIDTADNSVKKEIQLRWDASGSAVYAKNPYSKFVYASAADWNNGDAHAHLFILCAGLYSDPQSGGIIALDTTDLACESGYTVSESFVGGEICDFEYVNGKFYAAADGTATSDLYMVSPHGDSKTTIKTVSTAWSMPFVKVNPAGILLIGDRTGSAPGIWLFDTSKNSFTSETVISTGLPPSDITIIQ
jgi:hypothetical protein